MSLHRHAAVGRARPAPPRRRGRRCPCRGACRTWSCGSRGSRCRQLAMSLLLSDRARSRSRWPRCRRRRCRPTYVASRTFMPSVHVLGIGLDVDDVAPHARAVAVDDAGHERHRDAGRGERHDRERPQLALGARRRPRVNSVPKQLAQALRRSKNRAPHDVHSWATRCGSSLEHQVVDQGNRGGCHRPNLSYAGWRGDSGFRNG